MRTLTKISAALTGLLIVGITITTFNRCGKQKSPGEENGISSVPELKSRESITFILGEDKEKNNPYYAEAKNYYVYNENNKTTYVITGIISLFEVLEYLNDNPPSNNMPWGVINLVSHGNQWNGLSAMVTPESGRATDERIKDFIENNAPQGLPSNILDEQTIIFVHGCGIGNNQLLIQNMAAFFRGKESMPQVIASRLFEYYSSIKTNSRVISSQRYFANAFLASYKMGYLPERNLIASDLHKSFPHVQINWQYALANNQPKWAGDLYHYTFEVPVKWIITKTCFDSLPDFTSQTSQCAWVKKQVEITDKLAKLELPAENFNWWLRKVYVNNPDGTKSQAIWVKGYCTIVCVVQPLIDENSDISALPEPFHPMENDEKYFYSYRYKLYKNYIERNDSLMPQTLFDINDSFKPLTESEDELYNMMMRNYRNK